MKKNSLFISLIFLFLLVLFWYIINYVDYKRFATVVLVTFLFNSLISMYMMLFSDKYDYSLNKMFWIFSFVFYSQIPTYQYIFNIEPWTFMSGGNRDETYLFANLLVSMALISYIIGIKISRKISKKTMPIPSFLEASFHDIFLVKN